MFKPMTFGYEWEVLVLKPNLMPLKSKDIEWLSNKLRDRFPWSRTGIEFVPTSDIKMLEIRSGIMCSYDEIKKKTFLQIDEIKKICKEKEWIFFPIATHPAIGWALGLHIHIGSIYDFKEAVQIANYLSKYAPCFAAITVNSPVWGLEAREYKSYRVLRYADWMSPVTAINDPDMAQSGWRREDVYVAVSWHPTIEIRVGDAPLSVEFAIEYVTFVCAFFIGILKKGVPEFKKDNYLESIENRWRALKQGLQAIFLWDGEKVEVKDILIEMLKIADLKAIGCEELQLIPKMLSLRQTQADWQLLIHKYNSDPHSFAKSISNVILRGDPFKEYLEQAPKLEPGEYLSIDDYILENIKLDTPYLNLYELLELPHSVIQEKLKKFEKLGYIKARNEFEEGTLYSRIK